MVATADLPAFPDDVPTVSLTSISLKKLYDDDALESRALHEAARGLGFIYLALEGHPEGDKLLIEAEGVFDVARQLSHIPREQREEYRNADNVIGCVTMRAVKILPTLRTATKLKHSTTHAPIAPMPSMSDFDSRLSDSS